jgi:hypothetical protein
MQFEGAIARRSTYFTLQDTIPLPMEVPAEVEEDPQEEDEDEEVEATAATTEANYLKWQNRAWTAQVQLVALA